MFGVGLRLAFPPTNLLVRANHMCEHSPIAGRMTLSLERCPMDEVPCNLSLRPCLSTRAWLCKPAACRVGSPPCVALRIQVVHVVWTSHSARRCAHTVGRTEKPSNGITHARHVSCGHAALPNIVHARCAMRACGPAVRFFGSLHTRYRAPATHYGARASHVVSAPRPRPTSSGFGSLSMQR